MKKYTIHEEFDSFDISIGDEVHDDLTSKRSKIINITEDPKGNFGIWLDNDYLGGGRHPWEISK